MRLTHVSGIFAVFLLAIANISFAGDASLTSRADSLKDELSNLRKVFGRRPASFIASTSEVFRVIDRSRDAAEDVQKLSGKNESNKAVGGAVDNLSERMTKMRSFINHIPLTDQERATVRNVDVKFGEVLSAWDAYRNGNSAPVYPGPGPSRPDWRPDSGPGYVAGNDLDRRARGMAVRYLSQTYGVYERDVDVVKVSNLGNSHRVVAFVRGRRRVVDLDAYSGRVFSDRAVD